MSDDTLTQIIADHIATNIKPVLRWAYTGVATLVMGTAFVVGMWYDLKQTAVDAAKDADSAVTRGRDHYEPMLNNHETRIVVLESRRPSKP